MAGLSGASRRMLNQLAEALVDFLSRKSRDLVEMQNKATIKSRDVQMVIMIYFPKGLLKYSLASGSKVVVNYNTSTYKKDHIPYSVHRDGKIRLKLGNGISGRSGITFPVSRVLKTLKITPKTSKYSIWRAGLGAGVYLASVVEYLIRDILDLASKFAIDHNFVRIRPRDILLGIKSDQQYVALFQTIGIKVINGGVVPHIHTYLLPKKHIKEIMKEKLPSWLKEHKSKAKNKGKRRYKPGTVALREIRYYQKTNDMIISKAPLERMVRKLFKEIDRNDTGYRFQKHFFLLVQRLIEYEIINILTKAQLLAFNGKRLHIKVEDISQVRRLEYPEVVDGLKLETPNKSEIHHLARRAGVKFITKGMKEEIPKFVEAYLRTILIRVYIIAQTDMVKTVTEKHLLGAVKTFHYYLIY